MNIDIKKNPPKMLAAIIDRWKDKAITPDMLRPEDIGQAAGGKMGVLYAQYQERLKILNACDFGDLLLHCIRIWKNPA
ncbi:UvrD-helicase domain-containing protein, partial [Klebsiella pneumoniae]|nr:UvrD-helicase domain-containing protein [Klebsiella pneumoniae]